MILLHTTKYSDSSVILHSFTREGGRESFLLRGVGKKGTIHAALHPMALLDYTASDPYKGHLRYIKDWSVKEALPSVRTDIKKASLAMFMGELLLRSLPEGDKDERIWDFTAESVRRLEACEGSCANFHLWFLSRYAALLGFDPHFIPQEMPEITVLNQRLMEISLDEALLIPLSGEKRFAYIDALTRYLEAQLGSSFHLKSPSVLHAIF